MRDYTVLKWIVGVIGILLMVLIFFGLRWYGAARPRRIIGLLMQVDDGPWVQLTGDSKMQLVRNDQQVNFKPRFEDDFENEADELGSVPTWTNSNPDIGDLNVSEDGRQASFVPNGKKGTTQIGILVDSDPGVDEVVLVGTADLQVLSGRATVIKLEGILAPKDAAPAPTPAPEPTDAPVPSPAPTDAPAPDEQLPVDPPADAPTPDLGGDTGNGAAPGSTEEPLV